MTSPAAAPVRPPRPRLVTIASWLQLAAVALLLVLAAVLVWHAMWWDGEIDRAARLVPDADPAEVADERFGNVVMSCVVGVPVLLLAALLGFAAWGVRRGSAVARVMVFVTGGLQLLCVFGQGCFAGMLLPFAFAMGGGPTEDWDSEIPAEFTPDESKFLQTLYGTGPDPAEDVFFAVGGLAALLVFGLTLAAVVLLALPTSHRWFVPASGRPPGAPHRPPVAYPVPAAFLLPPGYMICPDPSAHGIPPQPAPAPPAAAATPPAGDPTAPPDSDPTASGGDVR
ncbi:hypothetical protein [Micromonospora sp. DT47]|uniref:hypothetical protein n=1 Tax=Micromonospora sp. DT47 TaxID=3393431 RepID=UPI003CF3D836